MTKLIEKLLIAHLIRFQKYNLNQRTRVYYGRCTTTNIYLNYLLNTVNQGANVQAIYTDFSNASDMVDYDILLGKASMGWEEAGQFHSYLTGGFLQVRRNGQIAESYEVMSGILRGSHLGPILSNIFINDIADSLHSDCLLYTGDMKIFKRE